MLTAEIGGSGGRPIESGLVVEEPDIEIGAGVSSKAISRRMQTDKSGSHGPQSTRTGSAGAGVGGGSGGGGGGGNGGGWGRKGRKGDDQASGANAQPLTSQQFAQGGGFQQGGFNYSNGF